MSPPSCRRSKPPCSVPVSPRPKARAACSRSSKTAAPPRARVAREPRNAATTDSPPTPAQQPRVNPRPMPAFPEWTWDIPEYFNIGAACTDAHLGTAVEARAAVICDDAITGPHQATFGELADSTSRFGQLLRNLGIEAGARVLIRLPNCLEYSTVFLGALKRGAIPVPTSILLTGDEVLFLARDSGASALVTTRAAWNEMHAAFEALDSLTHVL